ncbi:hypothetical protein [Reichenbachiella sp. MALMAid0571]|uniref:hypothetical protein n=1 Tax=Reichenbachiella sp. MALMAid0571 TaxID=3143939 RepID=UPI0032E02D37
MKVELNKLFIAFWLLFSAQAGYAENYYINSNYGSDSNSGTSIEKPWETLTNLNRNLFLPGDSILFARGSSYKGGFVFNNSGAQNAPIVFSSYSAGARLVKSNDRRNLAQLFVKYGAGLAPSFSNPNWHNLNGNIFRIMGSYVVIDGLYFHDNAYPPGSNKQNKNVQKMGAVYFAENTHHNVLQRCEFFHSPVAVKVKGQYNLIIHNYMHDAADTMARSWGPIAIMITSKYNEIAYNKVMNYGSYGGVYGSDGGVIELDGVDDGFDASDIHIHHNISINNHGFLEIAARNVDNITVTYNLSDDRNQFVGGGSMYNVVVMNNTVIRTREPNVDRYVFWTFYPENTSFFVSNNIFVLARDIQVFGSFKIPRGHQRVALANQSHHHNLFYSQGDINPIGDEPGEGDIITDPRFIDAINGNFRLKPNSPARNNGNYHSGAQDLDGIESKKGLISIGAYN